ncbi:MAG: homocysteine S-methyltransferase family protein [Actinomycetota bacterium]|nr:homocysteine S-methyltransferase family protein [Actinomycetota bacterium]
MSRPERDILGAARERVIVFDGGMGATLEHYDLSSEDYGGLPGKCHEVLVLQRPDVIEGVHDEMLEAGAEVLETDSFQGSRLKLGEWGLAEQTVEINRGAAEIARRAAGPDRYVAGSIGPTGFLPASDDPTLGDISFRRLAEVFDEQAGALIEGGVDLLTIETVQDILEVKAAIAGAREAFTRVGRAVPIQVSVSLLPNGGKMLLGTDIQAVLTILESLRVDIVGLNCSTGPADMRDAIRYLGENATVPVHCIPNAGLPVQGPDGETIFPETPAELSTHLGEFVDRHGVGIVGGCCGTNPEHIAALVERVAGRVPGARPEPGPPRLASMMTAFDLVQEPRPTIVGERVNSQGSRKAKEMLLADDYDGLVQIAEDQVEGGAHVLDVCVALTEREDEDEQMGETVSRISLTQPAPIQIDSTEPQVIEAALERIPGRAIVNSTNLEAGRDKLDRIVPIARKHGAALIALTIDEVGMAKSGERKLEIASRIHDLACGEHGLDPELLIFDALTFTLTTGEEEWRHAAVETIDGIRRIKAGLPGVKTSLGVSNVSFGISPRARAVLNSVFLHHCVEAGLDLAMVNPNHITPYGEITTEERGLADDLVFDRSDEALEKFIAHFESKGPEEQVSAADATEGMEPEEALHFHILRRKKDGVEDWIDRSVEKIGAVPTLNGVLLPAMKEVGDKFGAGELILPFVLQSAEVMKRAVARLENYLDRIEGHTKGTVVIATVFGDVHDIGKSLVNTILTNNGYTVVDLGKQVPIEQIIDAAVEHDADAIGLSALLVSTSKQMPACIGELHERGHEFPVLIGGAAINRDFGRRVLYPKGRDSDEVYGPGVFYCKDAFSGLDTMDALVDDAARAGLISRIRAEAQALRDKPVVVDDSPPTTDQSVRSNVSIENPIPEPPAFGAREVEIDLDRVYPYLDRHVLFKLHWGGRGVKDEAWRRLLEGDGDDEGFTPKLERMWQEQDYLRPRARIGYFPCNSDGNELVVFDPADHDRELERLVFPRQPKHDRICLADFYRPIGSGERDVVVLQGVTVGPEVTERIAELEREGEFAEQLFTHGLGVQAAEGLAEWLHAEARRELDIDPGRGRRYSWGYPACPDQSEHEKVWSLLGLEQIGMTLSDGYAVEPEQSTVAIIAHHPQAVYFGMKSGFVPAEPKSDELIAGTTRGGVVPPDDDFQGDGTIEAEQPSPATDAAPA